MKKTIKTIALLCVPYAFFAILSNKRAQDKRLIKYFFPYEKVRLNVLARYGEVEARRAFGYQITKTTKKGIKGFVRSWLPFGLVLWLDNGAHFLLTRRVEVSTMPAKGPSSKMSVCPSKQIDEFQNSLNIRLDRLEIMILRLLAKSSK